VLSRIIVLGLLFYLIYRVVRFFQSIGADNGRQNPKATSNPGKMMVKDEICNTYLPEDEALKEVHGGQTYYFCSEECRKKFLASKEKGS
jgi:YHS domain-containing protein